MKQKRKPHQFRIDLVSDDTGERYEGSFACKRWSILDQSRINRRKSELSGGMYVVRDDDGKPTGQGLDEFTENLNYTIAVCEVLLVDSPEWFDLDDFSDTYVLVKVFEEVMQHQNSFRKRTRDTDQESDGHTTSGEGSSSEERTKTVDKHLPQEVVDRQVQAALEP